MMISMTTTKIPTIPYGMPSPPPAACSFDTLDTRKAGDVTPRFHRARDSSDAKGRGPEGRRHGSCRVLRGRLVSRPRRVRRRLRASWSCGRRPCPARRCVVGGARALARARMQVGAVDQEVLAGAAVEMASLPRPPLSVWLPPGRGRCRRRSSCGGDVIAAQRAQTASLPSEGMTVCRETRSRRARRRPRRPARWPPTPPRRRPPAPPKPAAAISSPSSPPGRAFPGRSGGRWMDVTPSVPLLDVT